jgi:hypothetical protein
MYRYWELGFRWPEERKDGKRRGLTRLVNVESAWDMCGFWVVCVEFPGDGVSEFHGVGCGRVGNVENELRLPIYMTGLESPSRPKPGS